ncbi:MAG: hypothetical protein IE909_11590, partial [Campylobacterales bacterium]|nr:hypothetical protein [Campylobacterales bacterium]
MIYNNTDDIYNVINQLNQTLLYCDDIDDVIIKSLQTLQDLRNLYRSKRFLFNQNIIQILQKLKSDIQNIDQCYELIYDDYSQQNKNALLKYKGIIPQNEYLLS